MGILGPHIATEADARQLVRACYFGPLGERSFGGNRGTDYNAVIPDKAAYYRETNEQMLVCALLEDVAVLDNLDAILAVPGIDLYGIGPNDFAQSLGYPGELDHPEVVKATQEITRRIHQAGRRMQADVMESAGISDMLLEGGRRILETYSVFRLAARRTNPAPVSTEAGGRAGERKTCWTKPRPPPPELWVLNSAGSLSGAPPGQSERRFGTIHRAS